MKPIFNEELAAAPGDLLVFVDDTGHETFAGNQGFYGLGGCATTRLNYEHLKAKWCETRKIINGDPNAPLHASELDRKPENFAALSEFFLDRSFVRIAVTTTKDVGLPADMHPCVPVMGQLRKEIAAVASVVPCQRVWIIIESSKRADLVVKNCFAQLTSLNLARTLPVEHCFMQKGSNEPGLEVADFIISAASSEVQRRLRGTGGHALDFKDVFWSAPGGGLSL
jgi:hypothetical protein